MNKIIITFLMLSITTLSLAKSSDLLISPTMNKTGQTEIKFEFINDDNVTAMDFEIDLSGFSLKAVNLKNCVAGLSKSHQGICKIVKGKLKVLIFSMTRDIIPTGTLGSISVNMDKYSLKTNPTFAATNLNLAAPNGVKPKGKAFVDSLEERTTKTGFSNK